MAEQHRTRPYGPQSGLAAIAPRPHGRLSIRTKQIGLDLLDCSPSLLRSVLVCYCSVYDLVAVKKKYECGSCFVRFEFRPGLDKIVNRVDKLLIVAAFGELSQAARVVIRVQGAVWSQVYHSGRKYNDRLVFLLMAKCLLYSRPGWSVLAFLSTAGSSLHHRPPRFTSRVHLTRYLRSDVCIQYLRLGWVALMVTSHSPHDGPGCSPALST